MGCLHCQALDWLRIIEDRSEKEMEVYHHGHHGVHGRLHCLLLRRESNTSKPLLGTRRLTVADTFHPM